MSIQRANWAVVLAAGSGNRLSRLTRDAGGRVTPKQFCSFGGGPSLLRRTLDRMGRVVDPDRIVVVVSAEHRAWWPGEVADLPPENVVVQPCNRGTACGVLLPLTAILDRDPAARVVVTPSDHLLRNEGPLEASMAEALAWVHRHPQRLVLLGIAPDRAETEYGWIVAGPAEDGPVREVASFEEKPDHDRARRLLESGALWSSFIFAATAEALMEMFRHSLGWLVDRFSLAFALGGGVARDVIVQLYDGLPSIDLSGQVLQREDVSLHVLPVPPCGWTDLGSPRRVADCVHEAPGPIRDDAPVRLAHRPDRTGTVPPSPPDLAEAVLRDLRFDPGPAPRSRHPS